MILEIVQNSEIGLQFEMSALSPDLKIGSMRCTLTATATRKLQVNVTKLFDMKDELVVSTSPCKPNIMFAITHYTSIQDAFQPVVERLSMDRVQYP